MYNELENLSLNWEKLTDGITIKIKGFDFGNFSDVGSKPDIVKSSVSVPPSQPPLQEQEAEKVFLTHVDEALGTVWFTCSKDNANLLKLEAQLKHFANTIDETTNSTTVTDFPVGDYCIYEGKDALFARGIVSAKSKHFYTILSIDTGKVELCPVEKVKPMPKDVSNFHPFAYFGVLSNEGLKFSVLHNYFEEELWMLSKNGEVVLTSKEKDYGFSETGSCESLTNSPLSSRSRLRSKSDEVERFDYFNSSTEAVDNWVSGNNNSQSDDVWDVEMQQEDDWTNETVQAEVKQVKEQEDDWDTEGETNENKEKILMPILKQLNLLNIEEKNNYTFYASYCDEWEKSTWITLTNNDETMDHIIDEINAIECLPVKEPIEIGAIYCAGYSQGENTLKYRAQAVEEERDEVKVYFIDYGNFENIKKSELYHIPESCKSYTPQALKSYILDSDNKQFDINLSYFLCDYDIEVTAEVSVTDNFTVLENAVAKNVYLDDITNFNIDPKTPMTPIKGNRNANNVLRDVSLKQLASLLKVA